MVVTSWPGMREALNMKANGRSAAEHAIMRIMVAMRLPVL